MIPVKPQRSSLLLLLAGASLALLASDSLAAHPTGEVDQRQARRHGVEVDDGDISCFDCHSAHGVTLPAMLTQPATTEGCLSCHTRFGDDSSRASHPWDVSAPSVAAADHLREAGWTLGSEGELTCLSCHAAHRDVSSTQTCASCHGDQARGGVHDPVACLDCHTVHPGIGNHSRRTAATGDPAGCLSCHGAGGSAHQAGVTPGRLGHPADGRILDSASPGSGEALTCETCHAPHGPPLTATVESCGECHDDQLAAHSRGGHGDTSCTDCHPVHRLSPMDSGRISSAELNPRSEACLSCHGEGGSAKVVEAYDHPTPVFDLTGKRWAPLGELPLYSDSGEALATGVNGDLTCSSCHLTHGPEGDKTRDSLRRDGWRDACSSCHGDDSLPLYRYFHQPERRKHIEVSID